MAFLGETVCEAMGMVVHPRRFRFADSALAFQRAAFDGLPISTGIGFLLGVILAFPAAFLSRRIGLKNTVLVFTYPCPWCAWQISW